MKKVVQHSMLNNKGFTFIDVLVGTALTLIIFAGIFGAYQLGIKVVGQSKNKITATAIINQQLERIRNLPYDSVGVTGAFPEGVLEPVSTTSQNNLIYTVETRVDFVIDSADGISSPDDDCPNDYKKAEVKVFWSGRFPGEVEASTDISPKNLAQECAVSGGVLAVSAFDAQGLMIFSPLIEVRDPLSGVTLKTAFPESGKHYFSLATSTYKVIVSKTGYSQERTYGIDEITTPEKPHPIVLEDQMIEISFSIDRLSSLAVDTMSPWGQDFFSDSFLNADKASDLFNVTISGGEAKLSTTTEGYLASGSLASTPVLPSSLLNWDEFTFNDVSSPNSDLSYQIFYASGTDWLLIPDSELAGNSPGFNISPVDLSSLDSGTYSRLKLKASFSTNSTSTTPVLYQWQLSWITSLATAIPQAAFNLRGAKIIGLDSFEQPVYKYLQNHISNGQGHIDIIGLEWDSYTFSVEPDTGLDLTGTDPLPQPISLNPDTALPVNLYLDSENSLLLTIQNLETLEPVFSASTTLFKVGYSQTQYTDERGQTYFIPLAPASYNLNVSSAGYAATSTQIAVSGDTVRTVKLRQIE